MSENSYSEESGQYLRVSISVAIQIPQSRANKIGNLAQ